MSKAISVVVPYNRLRLSASNVRRTRGTPAYKAGIVALAASILSTHKQTGQGLLQNLVGHKVEGDFVDVAAGGRRFDAISFLVESGEFTDDYPVPVLIVGADAVTAASLSENVQREAMHPADEYDAFLSLVEQGWTIDRIADGFGVTPLVVERRLKLRAAAPALLADFREGLMSTDQLIALCSTDNHVRQLEVWSRVRHQTWNKEPHALRRAVIETEVEAAKDSRVVFIGGVEAYEKAGGMVRRDLFASEGEGVILEDSALLDRLVDEKLHEHSEEVGTEGWGWVEVWPQWDYTTFDRLGKAPRKTVELSDGAKQQLTALEKELEDAQTAVEDLMEKGDRTDEYEARLDALDEVIERLESEIADLQRSSVVYAAEVMEHAGALVVLQHGQLRIERGLVRSADRAKVASLLEDGQSISGGRETESAGRKADAISDALRRSLLGHRNLAAQFVAATNAKVAKILLVCQLVTSIRNTPSAAPTDMSVTNGYGTRTYCVISDEAGQAKGGDFVALGEGLVKELPQEHGELQTWINFWRMQWRGLSVLLPTRAGCPQNFWKPWA